jgi:APA family basic amino acid/polyamine antiporter
MLNACRVPASGLMMARPYRAFGYPIVPAPYIVAATGILIVLAIYRASTTWPGLAIVLSGVPVYLVLRRTSAQSASALAAS